MEHIDIFILFPESDEEILALGEEPEQYHAIVRELQEVIYVLDAFDYRLYYDETNLKSLIAKAQEICDEKYLSNPIQQLRFLLSKRTTNIRKQRTIKTDCTYYKWDLNNLSTVEAADIVKASVEKVSETSEKSATVIISFIMNDSHHRDALPVIKDAKHIKELPKLFNVHYFNPVNTFIQWYKIKSEDRTFCLQDVTRFERTSFIYHVSKQRIYKEISTSRYWYYDYFHRDNYEHYEVFNQDGTHYAEADKDGRIDTAKKDKNKSIKKIIV